MQRPRRFWKEVAITETGDGGYALVLDGKNVKGLSRDALRLATKALAEAVAEEWRAQGETIDPQTMPLTQLANTLQERVIPLRAEIVEGLMAYVDTDALCYRDEWGTPLSRRQAETWDALLDWVERRFGARLRCGEGVMPFSQTPEVHHALRHAVKELDDAMLTVLQVAVPLCSSLCLGLALVHGEMTAEDAFRAAVVDETFQAERWGEDGEALDRRARLREELVQAERFLTLSRCFPVAP